jgi:predicted dehydrogenase
MRCEPTPPKGDKAEDDATTVAGWRLKLQKLRVGVVGAGRMGRIRSLSAKAHPQSELVEVVDAVAERARLLATEVGCQPGNNWQKLIEREDVDAIVVATPHKYLAPITTAALNAGKCVFCEKPGARNVAEADLVLRAAYANQPTRKSTQPGPLTQKENTRLFVGFTLRHYPAVTRARDLIVAGIIGEPLYVRGRYGHGGRPGYNLEWRGDREMAGGGELLDQGVHLIDLSRCFLGEFEQVFGSVSTYFWGSEPSPNGGKLEDNAFLCLRTNAGKLAWLHASWTQWKNLFSFEIYGEGGSLQISGLGGHYGPQQLQIVRRRSAGGPPDVQETEFASGPEKDALAEVWTKEWATFISGAIGEGEKQNESQTTLSACGLDAWEALNIVEATYEASRKGTTVMLRRPANGVHEASLTAESRSF